MENPRKSSDVIESPVATDQQAIPSKRSENRPLAATEQAESPPRFSHAQSPAATEQEAIPSKSCDVIEPAPFQRNAVEQMQKPKKKVKFFHGQPLLRSEEPRRVPLEAAEEVSDCRDGQYHARRQLQRSLNMHLEWINPSSYASSDGEVSSG